MAKSVTPNKSSSFKPAGPLNGPKMSAPGVKLRGKSSQPNKAGGFKTPKMKAKGSKLR